MIIAPDSVADMTLAELSNWFAVQGLEVKAARVGGVPFVWAYNPRTHDTWGASGKTLAKAFTKLVRLICDNGGHHVDA